VKSAFRMSALPVVWSILWRQGVSFTQGSGYSQG
jgi:hypothetical protein